MTAPSWLALLAPLPSGEGECARTTMTDAPLDGWVQVQFVVGNGVTGLRVITAMFDPEGRPGMVSDLVATEAGRRQETMGARIESDGTMAGTHWLTDGGRQTPRPLTTAEQAACARWPPICGDAVTPAADDGPEERLADSFALVILDDGASRNV